MNADLIGHWRFDETTGSTLSNSVDSNDGTWTPGIDTTPDWRPTEGLLGGALEFPGDGNHENFFTVSAFPSLNGTPSGLSISVWLKPNGTTGHRGILSTRTINDDVNGGGINQNYGVSNDDGAAEARISGRGLDSDSGSLPDSGNWIHLCSVWDNSAGTVRIFINGVQSGPTNTDSGTPAGLSILSNGDWRIGDDSCCNDRNFSGFMDDLGIWNEPLSESAVNQIYQNGLAGLAIGEILPTDPLEVGLVINEIHYDPDLSHEPYEFIEVLNTNSSPFDASDYSFVDGITASIPANTILEGTEYLLLAEDPDALRARFPSIPAETNIFPFTGSLNNDGETITLIDDNGTIVDSVDYRSEFPWPISANGEGPSMQLRNATLNNNLGSSWQSIFPTPAQQNGNFSQTSPPLLRQVDHSPNEPISTDATTITVKVTDSDGVSSVNLLYQIVSPGNYIPAFLPNDYSTFTNNPGAPQPANPDFESPANWTTITMVDNGTNGDSVAGDDTYTAVIPAQAHRTLVRYRITATDTLNESIRAPFADDDSLNFAYFVYNGVPDYVANGTTFSSELLTTLPVYTMITRDEDRSFAYAYSTTGDGGLQIPKGNVEARRVYNWECALVFDGVVYDHVGWRLRQRNDRYAGNGKRSMRFRFNRGNYFQGRDEEGNKLSVKWRRMNTSKMSRFGGTNSYGLHETINSKLWRMVGVEAPYFLPGHFRMIDGASEAPDQYNGDFFGFITIVQDIDGRLLDERNLESGNMYKLKDGVTNPLDLQRNQGSDSVSDASDFNNVKNNLDSSQDESWLRDHVNWDQWSRYHAVVEAVRHYDFGTPSTHFKNRAWYFQPGGSSLGRLRLIPHDHDASWSKGYHDNLNDVGNSIGTGFPWAAIFDDITRPPSGTEKENLTTEYRNFIREFRDILWQEETVNTLLDDHMANLQPFTIADQARWVGGPAEAGVEQMAPIEDIINEMQDMAFVSDTVYGSNLVGGRGAFLDQVAAEPEIPNTPTISYSGTPGFPVGLLTFDTTAFSDPQGNGTFGNLEWRIAEVNPAATNSDDRRFEWTTSWTSGPISTFATTITPPPVATKADTTYRARVRHQDSAGHWSHWSPPLEFTTTTPDLMLYTSSLVISEIMYHPTDPTSDELLAGFTDSSDFEYLEIRNLGPQTLDFSNLRFTKGVDFDFAGSAVTSLAPDAYVIVVNNLAAFEHRYGNGHPIAGEWSGNLANGGERIKLSYGAGETVIDFEYFDSSPWPNQPDGTGASLTLVRPHSFPVPSEGLNWRASPPTPGITDGVTFPGGDSATLLSYATGGFPTSLTASPGTPLTFSIVVNQLAEDLIIAIESSSTLNQWQDANSDFTLQSVEPLSGNFSLLTFTSNSPATDLSLFLRSYFTIE